MRLTSLEICAGAGGQALGLELAKFVHVCLVENDVHACQTLRTNRPRWRVERQDLNFFDPRPYRGVDLVAGGVPCPPFSVAGKQLGRNDERDLFPVALDIVNEAQPKAILLENVKGLLEPKFSGYREQLLADLSKMGYLGEWRLMHASDFGVSQLRPRAILVAMKQKYIGSFRWPKVNKMKPKTVGELLHDLIASDGWEGADEWKEKANRIAPTLVGGSKKHGGPDLGPTRAKRAWAELSVNGHKLANAPPPPGFQGREGMEDMPNLTVRMAARIQGFPDDWTFCGSKTHAYRQVGNAFPPPVAQAIGRQIMRAIETVDGSFKNKLDIVEGELFVNNLAKPRRFSSGA